MGRTQTAEDERKKDEETRKLIAAAQEANYRGDTTSFDYITRELHTRGVGLEDDLDESPETFNGRMPAQEAPKPAAKPPVDRTPVGPRPGPPPPTASFPPAGEAEAAPPMRAVPAGPPPPRASASFPPINGAPPPGPAPAQAPAARPPVSPTEGVPFINKTQNMDWIEGKQPPLAAPARPMASDNAQFYDDMNWHPPTEKELLDKAIADVVAREAAGQAPTTRPLLPGKTLHRRAAEADQMLSPDDPLLNRRAP